MSSLVLEAHDTAPKANVAIFVGVLSRHQTDNLAISDARIAEQRRISSYANKTP